MNHICRMIICVVVISATFESSGETQFTNEFWISTVATGTNGVGTLDRPFDGSTQGNFDYWLNWLPTNATLHILAGTYQTLGSAYAGTNNVQNSLNAPNLKTGQKIIGSGVDTTVIQLAANTRDFAYFLQSGPANREIEISDLTLDLGLTPSTNRCHGVNISGTQNKIRRVKAISFGHPDYEQFPIQLTSAGLATNQISEGNIIEECEVSQGRGNKQSALNMNGTSYAPISGIMRKNRVLLTAGLHNSIEAINGAYMTDMLIEGNYVNGAGIGFYGDTGGYTNVMVLNNIFRDVNYGIYLGGYDRRNLTFGYNTINLTTKIYPGFVAAFLFRATNTVALTNIVAVGNTVGFDGAPVGSSSAFETVLDAGGVLILHGLIVTDNAIHPALANNKFSPSLSINVGMHDNRDLQGNSWTSLNQVEPPNGISRVTVNTASYNVGYADHYIGIKTTGTTVEINLPSAIGRAGKEFVIAKEISNGNTVNINATSPDTINGGTSVSFGASYGSRAVISDGANWFARQ